MLTHRLRGHRVKYIVRHIDTTYRGAYGVGQESGLIRRYWQCSCGDRKYDS